MPRSLTIFVRHELELERRRQLAEAGVAVVVDPRAPSCAIADGAGSRLELCPTCAALDYQQAGYTSDRAPALYWRARRARAARRA